MSSDEVSPACSREIVLSFLSAGGINFTKFLSVSRSGISNDGVPFCWKLFSSDILKPFHLLNLIGIAAL